MGYPSFGKLPYPLDPWGLGSGCQDVDFGLPRDPQVAEWLVESTRVYVGENGKENGNYYSILGL